VLKTQTAVYHR